MNTFEVQPQLTNTPFHLLPRKIVEALKFLALISFITITNFPSPALAYANGIEGSGQPLTFVVDDKMTTQATSGMKYYNVTMSAHELLHGGYARIPDYSPIFYPDQVMRVIATAYSSTVGQTDSNPFNTASGTYVHPGTLAANFLPFGTKVEIGGKTYIVEDRLNARYNETFIVDIWMASQSQALSYGIRVEDMKIISLP